MKAQRIEQEIEEVYVETDEYSDYELHKTDGLGDSEFSTYLKRVAQPKPELTPELIERLVFNEIHKSVIIVDGELKGADLAAKDIARMLCSQIKQ